MLENYRRSREAADWVHERSTSRSGFGASHGGGSSGLFGSGREEGERGRREDDARGGDGAEGEDGAGAGQADAAARRLPPKPKRTIPSRDEAVPAICGQSASARVVAGGELTATPLATANREAMTTGSGAR